MRCVTSLALTVAGVIVFACSGELDAAEMRVTLLGTGTPTPRLGSFSASTLVEVGSERLLFDLGRGSTIRLFQKKIRLSWSKVIWTLLRFTRPDFELQSLRSERL